MMRLELFLVVCFAASWTGFTAAQRVDRFGQPADEDFAGKVKCDAELRVNAATEAQSLPPVRQDSRLDAHGGVVSPQLGLKSTGFFRVERIHGRWWFVTPEGNPFFLVGCDAVNYREGGYTTPLRDATGAARPELADLPDQAAFPEAYGHDGRVSFLVANLKRKYGDNFATVYDDVIRRRLSAWCFNSTAKWGWGKKFAGVPYFEDVYLTFCKFGGNFVDMYDPSFERRIDELAKTRTAARRGDSDLIAWSVDNENGWWYADKGDWSNKVFRAICSAKDGTPGGFAKRAFLESVAAMRGVPIATLCGLDENAFTVEEKRRFVRASSARYHRIVSAAFRKYDSDHLFMGAAICLEGQLDWIEEALPYLDFVGLHQYGSQHLSQWHRNRLLPMLDAAAKPFALLEFGFTCAGAGFKRFFADDAICRDHRARGQAYRQFAERIAAEPQCVGFAYFLYHDQPISGRSLGGEAYNLGLVSQQDRPYDEMIEGVRKANAHAFAIHAGKLAPNAVRPDAHRPARLKDVKLKGFGAEKMNALFRNRIFSDFAQRTVFAEAREAFRDRDDDALLARADGHRIGGWWRGEFWGKLMIGAARVLEYSGDPKLRQFVVDECRRMMACQDADGYLGSYADKENVSISEGDRAAVTRAYGWNSNWNVWCRKYTIWGMLAAYRATGERDILESVRRQTDQLIKMMHGMGLRLSECGQPEKVGLPPMSILKPLLMLYAETGERRYLDFAEDMLPDWDRTDGACPNFFRNADRADALWTWYPKPDLWAKSYEMMSCLDGLLEHARLAGAERSLSCVSQIRDNLLRSEANVLGDVGHLDQFYGAADQPNASTEICNTIHWIRLNLDLHLMTGDTRYCDVVERAYYNAFLAGVYRDGAWGAFAVRSTGHHQQDRQCGYAYNHCCVNNMPRTFMDMAESLVTADAEGGYHVNFYQDATVALDGVTFEISGGYPVSNHVRIATSRPAKVAFRKPDWCPDLKVVRRGDCVYELTFDMNPRLVERTTAPADEARAAWFARSFTWGDFVNPEPLKRTYRHDAAATIHYGPLLLAKSRAVGVAEAELLSQETVNGKGYSLRLTPRADENVWMAWDVELSKPGVPTVRTRACDYQSAGDCPYLDGAIRYSVWF